MYSRQILSGGLRQVFHGQATVQVTNLLMNLEVRQGYSGRYLYDALATSRDSESMSLFLLQRSLASYLEYGEPIRDLSL